LFNRPQKRHYIDVFIGFLNIFKVSIPARLQLLAQIIGSSGNSWHQLPRNAGVFGSPCSVNKGRPVAGQKKFQSSRSSSMICMALAWVM
jgi:hypothetical protein